MILRYSFTDLWLQCLGDPTLMVRQVTNFKGEDFLINSEFLKRESRYKRNHLELSEYLGLASFRNYTDYVFRKKKSLDIFLIPDYVPISIAEGNKYLRIEGDELLFVGEEF